MSKPNSPTLGQKIDSVLEPLYTEAEQHRATIALVKEQQEKLQQQIDAAEQGLSQIETRMAEVVRALACEEPVIAAVVGQTSEAAEVAEWAEATTTTEPTEPTEAPDVPAEQGEAQEDESIEAVDAAADEVSEAEMPVVELDPEADAAAVDEAAALLQEPAEEEPEKLDLTAAAERAAEAARQLREKAGSS